MREGVDMTQWSGEALDMFRCDLTAWENFRKVQIRLGGLGKALDMFRCDSAAWRNFRKVQIRLEGLGKP